MENPNWLIEIRVYKTLQVEIAKVYSGGSMVLAVVVIVVKYRACLLVGRLIIGVSARLVL
jgi:hypothetical protein